MASILLISQQQMLKAGNQVLLQTVLGYARAGHRVVVLLPVTNNPAAGLPDHVDEDLRQRICVVSFPESWHRLANWAKGLRGQRRSSPGPAGAFLEPSAVIPFSRSHPLFALASWASFSLGTRRAALALAREDSIDLVCGFEVFAAPVARVLSRRWGVPLVTKYQGTFLYPELKEKWKLPPRWPVHWLGTRVPADLVFMENDGTRSKEVLLHLGIREETIRFRLAGLDPMPPTHDFDRGSVLASLGIPNGEKVRILLNLSKATPWKRVDRCVGAMPRVLARLPDTYLIIPKRGSEIGRLMEMARALKVDHRVLFIDPVPQPQVRRLLQACDVFLSTHDHSNLSIPVLEALQVGKPIITLDDGSTDGVLVHGQNAILVPMSNIVEGLATAIIGLLEDEQKCRTLGRCGRRFAQENLLDWETRMKLETDEMAGLLSRPRGGAHG